LENDSTVEMSLVNGKLVIGVVTELKPTLKQLLAKVTDDNLHSEVDTGTPVGNEAW
jgi:antitoxin MazE